MSDPSTLPTPRLVAGLDFGTTYSGFAYAHTSDPKQIHTLYDWPDQSKGGGAPYCKTVTSSYYKSTKSSGGCGDQKLVEWGWPARVRFSNDLRDAEVFKRQNPSASDTVVQVGHYLQRFKLHLASNDAGPAQAPVLPPGLSTTQVISDFLGKMGEFIMTHLRGKYGKHLDMEVIQWCVSVPSIWDDNAKQKMKECMKIAGLVGPNASPYPPLIVLEPEAASLYCQQKCNELKLRMGDKFLVVDIGGGTTDIVMQEKASDGETLKVREVTRSSGGLCGGVDVDKNFISFLSKKIGCFR